MLEDDNSQWPQPPTQRRRIVPKAVERGASAAADVQDLFDSATVGEGSKARPSRSPASKQSPNQSNHSSIKHLDLRALSASETGTTNSKPILRPRSTHPATQTPGATRRPPGAGPKRVGGGPRRHSPDTGDRPVLRRVAGRSQEDYDEDDIGGGEPRAPLPKEKTESIDTIYKRMKKAEYETPKNFVPEDITLESLRPYLPRLPIGNEGNAKLLEARMDNTTDPASIQDFTRLQDLADKLRHGHYVKFRSEEEKEEVVALARETATKKSEEKSERTGQVVEPILPEFKPLSSKSRGVLEQELFQGKYPSPAEPAQNNAINNIMHLIRKNGSYSQADEESLFKKLGQLLPTAAAKPKPTAPKANRKPKETA